MISKASFEKEHIRELQAKSHRDPILIERVIYAFEIAEITSQGHSNGVCICHQGG